jgi:nickel-dependent lactate racemase
MFGHEITDRIRIVNHDSSKENENRYIGITKRNGRVSLNRIYIEADKRILLGFIEPHFFAGFSGGPKGIAPGIAALETIMHIHRSELITDPNSICGEIEKNLIQQEIRQIVEMCPPHFLINVTLNLEKQITGFFCGNYLEAHHRGCVEVSKSSGIYLKEQYPLVITTNGGFPLDQNLYQTVKCMSAAANIVEPGGTIIVVSECRDGIPSHGQFSNLMSQGTKPAEILEYVKNLKQPVVDQWQSQILARILQKAGVLLYSSLMPDAVRGCLIQPISDIHGEFDRRINLAGSSGRVAIIPEGPYVIPSVE